MRNISILSILLMFVIVAGCLTQRRSIHQLDKIQRKHPALFSPDTTVVDSSRIDSLLILDSIVVQEESIDTAVVTALADIIETLTIENSRLKVQLITTPSIETDTRTWELSGTCKADTVYQKIKVPVRQVIYQRMPAQPCQVVKGAPWWYYLITAGVTALLTWASIKRKSVAEMVSGLFKGLR